MDDIVESHVSAISSHPEVIGTVGFKLFSAESCVNRFGVAVINEDGIVRRFAEKPKTIEQALAIYAEIENPGIKAASERAGEPLLPANASYYLLQGDFFDRLPKLASLDKPGLDFGSDIFPVLKDQVNAYFIDSPWLDVGTPRDYWKSQWYFMDVAMRFTGTFVKNWGSFGFDVTREGNTEIRSSVIGNGVYLRNVRADHAIIGEGCQLSDVDVSYSVVLPHTFVNMRRGCAANEGTIAQIENSIIGGKIIGGSFIDSFSIPTRRELRGAIAVPPLGYSKYIDIHDLPLTEEDLAEARRIAF